MTTDVTIVEVGPRDGLQNEPAMLSPAQRIEFIKLLFAAGLRTIEAGSFVSPRAIPQMTKSDEVLRGLDGMKGRFPVLVPNMRGFEDAIAAGAKEVAVFTAASETFSQRNINCSIDESFERFRPVCEAAKARGTAVRGYVSCVLGCPYEGQIAVKSVIRVAERLAALGCYEISLGDTIGVGTPEKARTMLKAVSASIPMTALAVHFHDTYGQALANIFACLDAGVRVIDSSAGGLGGCPYAKGATGNVATEDVVYMLNGLGANSGVELSALLKAIEYVSSAIGRPPQSRVARALLAKAAG